MLGSQTRQGLLGLGWPSAKHLPPMLQVVSWEAEGKTVTMPV